MQKIPPNTFLNTRLLVRLGILLLPISNVANCRNLRYNVEKCILEGFYMSTKKMCIANFNTVFEKNDSEMPMLEYFDSIIMPALLSNYIKKNGDTKLFFDEIEVIEDKDGEYILTGIVVKDTMLEVKYNYDYQEGRLVDRNGRYQSSPYSLFIIYLKNHRMVLVRDQKGSPSLNNFRTLIKAAIDTYIRKTNQKLQKEDKELLPIPLVNVVGISSGSDIASALKSVEKVTKLTLKFYPLNGDGDTDLSEVLEGILKKRHDLRSSTGNLNYNSPENKDEICNFVGKLNGTMEPVLHVRYPGSSVPSKITMDSIIENTEIPVADDDTKKNIRYIIEASKKNSKISYASKANTEIYEENCKKIVPFIKK